MPKLTYILFILLVVGTTSIAAAGEEPPGPLRVGAASVDITPRKLPVLISGSFRNREAQGIHDRLYARTIVIDDGTRRVSITLCDCLLLKGDTFDAAKRQAAEATGIPVEHMMMAATHTHTGPVTVPLGSLEPDPEYLKFLTGQLAASVVEANERLQPARAGWAVGQLPDEVHNRRWFVTPDLMKPDPFGRENDLVRTNPPRGTKGVLRPAGPVDPDVSLLSVRDAEGRPLALLANYSLHYVSGIPAGQLSADYFGEFARQIGERLKAPDDFVGILSNGTSGDINNINFRQVAPRAEPFERVKFVASQVADVAEQALESANHQEQLTVDVRHRTLTLGVRRPGAAELERAKQRFASADQDALTSEDVYALETIELSNWPATVEVPVQVMRIGQLGIVALPCEAFAEIGLEIKRHSPLETTFIVGLANDYHGYLPTPGQHALGGYETWACRWSYLEPDASTKISEAAVELLREVAMPADSATAEPAWQRALYLVVPVNDRDFGESLRAELNILGPHKTHWPQSNRFRFKHGYLGWLTIGEARKVSEHPKVKEVTAFLAHDVRVGARPRGIERNYLDVFLCPNSWEAEIDQATYRSAESLAAEWKRRFAHDPAVSVKLDEQSGTIRVTITGVKPDPEISAVIRRSGQVDKIEWSQDQSTP